LANVPTADILAPGEYCGANSTYLQRGAEGDLTLNNQVGITKWMEAGYDYSLTAKQGVGNVKIGAPVGNGAVGLGVQGLGDAREWYVVYSTNNEVITPFRLHVGAFIPQDNVAPYLGIEFPVKNSTLMLEGVAGDDDFAALGVIFPVCKGIDAMVSGIVGHPGGMQVYAELGYGLQF